MLRTAALKGEVRARAQTARLSFRAAGLRIFFPPVVQLRAADPCPHLVPVDTPPMKGPGIQHTDSYL